MRKLIGEVKNEGFEKLLGETVTLFCANYFYNGKLVGVNESCVLLANPHVIYETGPYTDKKWKDIQSMNIDELYVQKAAIEAFAKTK